MVKYRVKKGASLAVSSLLMIVMAGAFHEIGCKSPGFEAKKGFPKLNALTIYKEVMPGIQ